MSSSWSKSCAVLRSIVAVLLDDTESQIRENGNLVAVSGERLPARENVSAPRVGPRCRVESSIAQPCEPRRTRKQSFDVTIGLHSNEPVGFAQQERVDDLVGRVGWIGIPAPFQVSEPSTVRAVFAAM